MILSGFRWLPLWNLRGTDRDSDASDSAVTSESAVTLTVTRLGVVDPIYEILFALYSHHRTHHFKPIHA